MRTKLADLRLQFGDALLMQGPRGRLPLLGSEPDLILLSHGQTEIETKGRWRIAGMILVATLGLGVLWPELIGEIMLGGALAMVIAGMLSTDQAYQAIEWKTVVLVAGMLPAGMAMVSTGAASWLGERIVDLLGPAGPLAVLAGLVTLTALMTQVMNGAAVTAFMAPLAFEVGMRLGADPRAFVMGIALAASMAFLTPLGHPVNALVMGPGGYRFRDYFRVGWPLMLGLLAVVMVLLPVIWPLAPTR